MARVFIVEDNENMREAVTSYLTLADHEVVEFEKTHGVVEAAAARPPDLMILDVMLPDGDGFHLARRIRKTHSFPIIFLTARSSESDRITGFEVGGDDYVTKPFSPKELALRVEAVLKRTAGERKPADTGPGRWRLGERSLLIDHTAHRITADGGDIVLTAAEWKILEYLAANAGMVVGRDRLLGESLDYLYTEGSERTVDTHVKNIRSKLGTGDWIDTVRGFGYRFVGTRA